MKVKTLSALAGLGGALILSGSADAAYLGLGLTSQSVNVAGAGGGLKTVYRLYAVFNNAGDYTTGAAGSALTGTLSIQSLNATMNGPGSNFYNPASGGNTAPGSISGSFSPANKQWDTFATVGVWSNDLEDPTDDQTGTSPGFPNFIAGNSLVSNDMAWFTPGPIEQGRAGGANGVNGVFFNFNQAGGASVPLVGMGVGLAQLTVNAGGNVAGTIAVSVDLAGGLAGGQTIGGQTFASAPVPAPGALALLGLAGLVGARRRRA